MKNIKSCSSCLKGNYISIFDQVLCTVKGVVTPDYSCFKYKEMNLKLMDSSKLSFCMDCLQFQCENASENPMGVCKIFSVRKFNGLLKKSCSKFEIKVLNPVN